MTLHPNKLGTGLMMKIKSEKYLYINKKSKEVSEVLVKKIEYEEHYRELIYIVQSYWNEGKVVNAFLLSEFLI